MLTNEMPETSPVSLGELTRRFESIPGVLKLTIEQELERPARSDSTFAGPFQGYDVTGVGASEFPARVLVEALRGAGVRAQFRPISTYLGPPVVPRRTSLVVFSQGLSPNARLPFRYTEAYDEVHLFTSLEEGTRDESDRIFQLCKGVYRHLPKSEGGTLLRVVGPLCSALLALRWSARLLEGREGALPDWARRLEDVPRFYAQASLDAPRLGTDPAACLARGRFVSLASALMWKWQEALYTRLPPVFDVLSFTHGPLQSFVGKEAMFLAFGPLDPNVLSALQASMDQGWHHLLSLSAHLSDLLAIFEYDARVTAMALGEMKRRGISPGDWPGKAAEVPLYELGREL